ncbi:nucleotidyltransferase domain-containing protein [Nanoarchaeota archaeon]
MTKKSKKNESKKKEKKELSPQEKMMQEAEQKLPKEAQEKLKKIKEKLDEFQKQVVDKFDKYISGIALLPPNKPKEGEKPDEKINVLVLVDDSDSQKMSKMELKQKLSSIIESIGKSIDENLNIQTIIHTEIWQSCYDAKYDLLQMIAMSAPVYDTGILATIKVIEVHKTMVLKKFEKYIVSYVLSGSIMKGRAKPESDIDVFIVIDDTDVKRMTRAELKDKLRAIIIGMGIEAGEITGVKNKLHVQTWILTDFWDGLKEAHPVYFDLLRDGVPFYDRGIFMPWKQLLQMGRIKPSPEAIDMFMGSGDQILKRVTFKLNEIGMEDTFLSILTPTQAAIMLYGLPPPAPKETCDVLREIFVQKEKMLDEKYVKMLEKNYRVRKDIEHGKVKELSGKEVDELLSNAKEYLEVIKDLFKKIQEKKDKEDMVHLYDTTVSIVRDILRYEGVEKVNDADILAKFEEEMVISGKIPNKFLRELENIIKGKADYDKGKLTRNEVLDLKKNSQEFLKFMVEYLQRKRGKDLERARIRIKHGDNYGEVLLLDDHAFVIYDIDKESEPILKAKIKEDGSLATRNDSNLEEMEKALANAKLPKKAFIKEPLFESIKEIFGKNVEILVSR